MTATYRYLYHHGCAAITLSRPYPLDALPVALRERTHVCCCSAWRIAADGTLAVWRSGAWQAPTRGEVKSKVTDFALAPLGAVEALQRPTRARAKSP